MPKVVHTNAAGLVQSAGSRVYLRSNTDPGALITRTGAPGVLVDDGNAILVANIKKISTITLGADRSKATPTAAALINLIGLTEDDDSFLLTIVHLGTNGTRKLTITAGTGVTLVGSAVVFEKDEASDAVSSGSAQFLIRRTGAGAVSIYRVA